MTNFYPSLFTVVVFYCVYQVVLCSPGDRSNAFQNCMHWCGIKNCTNSSKLAQFESSRPWYLSFLQWECWDECDYFCMWHAVKVFQYHGEAIPQFHGKHFQWPRIFFGVIQCLVYVEPSGHSPNMNIFSIMAHGLFSATQWPFYRFLGLQEPASVLFSVLNGITHYGMWIKFKKSVPECLFKKLWTIQALLSINAWFWSAVFHARDTPLTEKLDYFCAFSLVLYSFYSLFVRLWCNEKSWLPFTIGVPFLAYFCYHIYYLSFVHFDYGYNLKVNIFVGLLNSFGWILWCRKHWHKSYVWKCAASVIAVNMLLLLELWDFPPWKFLIDAHALWHLGTIPVPLLWYSFLIEDCLNEVNCSQLSKKMG